MTCIALFPAVGKLQQWLLMFHNIVYLCLSLSQIFFFFKGTPPEGKCGRGLVDGWVFRHRQYFPHLSCLNASLLARLNHMCFHELITGTLEAWQEHGDHTLMEV